LKLSALPLVLLLALPSLAAQQAPPTSDPGASAWVITGHETCTETRLVVARNITVAAGGVLDLQGCVLAMDSPPYEDQYFAKQDEGLLIRVERGGRLQLQATPGHAAGIERADSRYGYTVTAFGDVSSIGLPGLPNVISGVEGAHEGQLAYGGLRVAGNATLRHTRFQENWGPSMFIIGGGSLDAQDVDFAGWGGLVGSRATSIRMSNVTATARNTPIAFSFVRSAVLEDCTVNGGNVGMFLTRSNVTLRRCSVASNGTAFQSVDANLGLQDTAVAYKKLGVELKHKSGVSHESRVSLRDSTVVGTGPNATSAITGTQSKVDVQGGRLASTKGPAINGTLLFLSVDGTALEGPAAIRAVDPFSARVQGVSGPSPHIDLWRTTLVRVVDRAGDPIPDVNVTLPAATVNTSKDGKALIVWHLGSADELSSVDLNGTVELKVVDPQTGQTITQRMPANLAVAQVTLSHGRPAGLTWAVVAGGVVIVALAIAVVVRMRRRKA
jgi:hypothetical protein